jgi:hypothetical protein
VPRKKKEPFSFQVEIDAAVEDKDIITTSAKLRLKLGEILTRQDAFNKAKISVSPTNKDFHMPEMVDAALTRMQELTQSMYSRLLDDSSDLAVFYTDLCALRDHIMSMQKTYKELLNGNKEHLMEKAREGVLRALDEGDTDMPGVHIITPDKLDTLSQDALHILAHLVSEQKRIAFDCKDHTLPKDELITWIKKEAFGLAAGKLN